MWSSHRSQLGTSFNSSYPDGKLRRESAVRWFGLSFAQNASVTNELHVSIATLARFRLTWRFSSLVHHLSGPDKTKKQHTTHFRTNTLICIHTYTHIYIIHTYIHTYPHIYMNKYMYAYIHVIMNHQHNHSWNGSVMCLCCVCCLCVCVCLQCVCICCDTSSHV